MKHSKSGRRLTNTRVRHVSKVEKLAGRMDSNPIVTSHLLQFRQSIGLQTGEYRRRPSRSYDCVNVDAQGTVGWKQLW
jgi:hypothetical protein